MPKNLKKNGYPKRGKDINPWDKKVTFIREGVDPSVLTTSPATNKPGAGQKIPCSRRSNPTGRKRDEKRSRTKRRAAGFSPCYS